MHFTFKSVLKLLVGLLALLADLDDEERAPAAQPKKITPPPRSPAGNNGQNP
jgi:hypothetical protein